MAMIPKRALFKFLPFSRKQKKILTWWTESSPVNDKDGIIADGAVRSGKTMSMSLSFVLWGMASFNGCNFIMAGKTIASFRRNVVLALKLMLISLGYRVTDRRSDNLLVIRKNGVVNNFFIFGGTDEASQDLIQGLTAAGALFDEVALMPQSFVNQAVARCSVDGSKLWFNCNPEGPQHPFKVEWIDKRGEKGLVYLHFVFDDNPSLSQRIKERYHRMFTGVFFDRYVRGLWVVAEGIIYPMFNLEKHVVKDLSKIPKIRMHWVGVDYGHSNATVFLLGGIGIDGKLYILDEDIHEAAQEGDKSPRQLSLAMIKFLRKHPEVNLDSIIVDPSAKGYIVQLREDGVANVKKGINDVLPGISLVSSMFSAGMIQIYAGCTYLINQLLSYAWDPKAQAKGVDAPIKVNDHAPDALRYLVMAEKNEWKRRVTNVA